MERAVLRSSLWDPVTGHVGMAQRSLRGGLDLTLGSISFPRGWSDTEQAS